MQEARTALRAPSWWIATKAETADAETADAEITPAETGR